MFNITPEQAAAALAECVRQTTVTTAQAVRNFEYLTNAEGE